jgi:cold shock CspA family protein
MQQIQSEVRAGKIIKYFPDRRYGFVVDDESRKDFFFHRGDCKDEIPPQTGDRVRFQIGEFNNRTKAFNVSCLRAQDVLGGKAAA